MPTKSVTLSPPGNGPDVIDYGIVNPVSFTPFRVGPGGHYQLEPDWKTSTFTGGPPTNPDWVVMHGALGVQVGRTDDVAVTVRWFHPTWNSILGQIGPAAMMNPNAVSDTGLGFGPVNDIGLGGAGYTLNVFRSPEANVLSTINGYYQVESGSGGPASLFPLGEKWTSITLTCSAGVYTTQWGDQFPHVSRPQPITGVDGWGVHVILVHPAIGQPSFDLQTATWTGPPITEYETPVQVDVEVTLL